MAGSSIMLAADFTGIVLIEIGLFASNQNLISALRKC